MIHANDYLTTTPRPWHLHRIFMLLFFAGCEYDVVIHVLVPWQLGLY